ncbi:hypothetical protein HK104_000762 [Borealophlyctis nickersoniae]|nr:hypothetical protein HK104_000762 [Borealophlyctis nickersoniae]
MSSSSHDPTELEAELDGWDELVEYDSDWDQEEPLEEASPSLASPSLADEKNGDSDGEKDASLKARLLINPNKAGTDGVDRDKINKIIYEASKGSPFFLNEQRRDQAITERINELLAKANELRAMDLSFENKVVKEKVKVIEATREVGRPMSLDEGINNTLNVHAASTLSKYDSVAYLDLTEYMKGHPDRDVAEVVEELRAEIHRRTRLTASAGIAPNKMLAKVCSDVNKPNGQKLLSQDQAAIDEFLSQLPIRKVPGIGRVSERVLQALGIKFCTDLRGHMVLLYKLFSPIMFEFFVRVSLGIGSTHVESEWERKSISTERTFSTMSDPKAMYEKLRELSQSLAEDLDRTKLKGRTVTLKLKEASFRVYTRAKTVDRFVHSADDLFTIAKPILATAIATGKEKDGGLKIRLMGLRLSALSSRELSEGGIIRVSALPPRNV